MTGNPTLDTLLAIVAGLASLGAGAGCGLVYAKRSSSRLSAHAHHSDPPSEHETRRAGTKRSEQLAILTGQTIADTWSRERADREMTAEAARQQAAADEKRDLRLRVASLEKANGNHCIELGRIDERIKGVEDRLGNQHAVLGSVYRSVIRIEAKLGIDSPNEPVRGGAAGPQ